MTKKKLQVDIYGMELKKFRKSLKLTQEKFAKPLGINKGYVSVLENGGNAPSLPLKLLIKCVYGFPEDEYPRDPNCVFGD